MKLLVVDDSELVRLKVIAAARGLPITRVIQARNGNEALVMMQEERPELVTMDLSMPELGGVECIGLMVRIEPKVRILTVSAVSDRDLALESLSKGALGFVLKPFSERHLQNALRELINTRI
jgi:two-component system, chemotaxis family, chemotaxis protein CheY